MEESGRDGDHPRVCGKDGTSEARRQRALGSPPRMRERPLSRALLEHQKGITPAYAGKTLPACFRLVCAGDHPRVCGKDLAWLMFLTRRRGSPPRMRERLHFYSHRLINTGITPAYAGKTCRCTITPLALKDHPRVCGKDQRPPLMKFFKLGSPPRMRERRAFARFPYIFYRITPAYAGKTT